MNTIKSKEALGILKILSTGEIISGSGSVSISYFLDNPTVYSLTEKELIERNDSFFRAFKFMGDNTYIHKQDLYIRQGFDSGVILGDSFIQKGERKFFNGKEYLNHICVLTFTLDGIKSLESSYVTNPLKYKENLTLYDKQRLESFLDEQESVCTVIKNIKNTKLVRMNDIDVKYYLFNFVNGFFADDGIRDNIFEATYKCGDKEGVFFALCEAEYLPDTVKTYVKDESLAKANSQLYCSMLERLGVHLKATHVINQIWKFNKDFRGDLSHKVKVFGQHRNFDKEIERDANLLNELEQEIINEGNIICKTHFNISILEDEHHFLKAIDYIKGVFKTNDFKYYLPSYEGLQKIYLGNIIGSVNKLDPSYYYLSDLKSSLCLMFHNSTFKQDSNGVFFTERLYNTPMKIDLWGSPLGKKLPARNMVFIASTGGGKSVTAQNIVQQYIESGMKLVIVEFGKSFYQLTQLYPDKCLHVDYDGNSPLGINSFRLKEGQKVDLEKINTLVNLVLKFWRSKTIKEDAKQVVSLREILKDYYNNKNSGHSFPDFYYYVKENFDEIAERLELNKEYFDYNSFIHTCKEFNPGGYYENICKESTLGAQVDDKDVIVFELTKIKKDQFLISVIMSILLDVIETKLLDKSVKGLLLFDEYAEVQTMKSQDLEDIHSTVAFCFQKLRKENSAVTIILQSPSQLGNNEFTSGIISNTQILCVLPTTEKVYDDVIKAFSIKSESDINLMKSIHNNFENEDKYNEVFFRFMDWGSIAIRLKLSPEKFYSFQTDGDTWSELQVKREVLGSLEKAIINKIKEKEI